MKNLIKANFRKFLKNKGRVFGLILLMFASLMIFGAMTNVFLPIERAEEMLAKKGNQEEFRLIISSMPNAQTIKEIEEKYQVSLEKNVSKSVVEGDEKWTIVANNSSINQTVLQTGRMPKTAKETLVDPEFLTAKGSRLGDEITVKNQTFKIVGTFYRPDYVLFSDINQASPISPENQHLISLTNEGFSNIPEQETIVLSGKSKANSKIEELKKDVRFSYLAVNDNALIGGASVMMNKNKQLSLYFSAMILICSIFILLILLKKIVAEQLKTFGVLLALGYKKRELLLSFLPFPLLIGSVSSIVGYILGFLLSGELRKTMLVYFHLPKVEEKFPFLALALTTFFIASLLMVATIVLVLRLLYPKALVLMNGSVKYSKNSWLVRRLKNLPMKNFVNKTALSFTLSRSKQLGLLIFTSFLSVFLLLVALLQFHLPNQTSELLKKQYHFDYMLQYDQLQRLEETAEENAQVAFIANVESLKKQKEKIDSKQVVLNASRFQTKDYLKLYNGENKSVNHFVTKNQAVVSRYFASRHNVKIGETLNLVVNGKNISFKVKEFVDDATQTIYADFDWKELQKLHQNQYNFLYTNKNVGQSKEYPKISRSKAIDNHLTIAKQLQAGSISIGIVAFIISVVLLVFTISSIVEDSKNNLVLLKLLGYRKRELNRMFLRNAQYLFVLSSILFLFFSSRIFQMMEKQLTIQLSMPLKIALSTGDTFFILSFLILLIVLVSGSQKRKINRLSINEVLFSR
ncbi:FtsX-like permease family protein [Pilibacter termitis]|uniref:FtsX-like permease family protein n=1 Tax=Pilibacter termitis TaxID=263852 RepID=A0A1T4N6D3_9ENTE|nr:ABC transporter permease [Pilibacter termitis]SJZ74870.1 FtsX-like permease family protein [Pilibacter termitis]